MFCLKYCQSLLGQAVSQPCLVMPGSKLGFSIQKALNLARPFSRTRRFLQPFSHVPKACLGPVFASRRGSLWRQVACLEKVFPLSNANPQSHLVSGVEGFVASLLPVGSHVAPACFALIPHPGQLIINQFSGIHCAKCCSSWSPFR